MATQIDGSDPSVFLGVLALLIGLGFIGNLIFSKLRFNDTLILIAVGVVVGPITGAISPDSLASASAIVGALALILILFDGGLALKVNDLKHGLGSAAVLGVVGFILTTGAVGGLTAFLLDIPIATGLLLGAILGGTSALVVLPSLEAMDVKKKTGTTLGLESALTDVLVVVVSFTLISIVAAAQTATTGDPINATSTALDEYAQGIASQLLAAFALGIMLGVVGGFLWLFLYPHVRDKPFGYMLTLGFMFFLYVAVEWLLGGLNVSGGGPLAVLAFGIILGNYASFGKRFITTVGEGFGQGMKKFQGEISFLVRTFFFVYLGILVEPDLLADARTLAIGILLFGGLLAARYVAVMVTTRKLKLTGDDIVLWVMGPRGLAAAVLAAVPAQEGIPGTESFVALAFLILVLSNLFATVGTIVLEKKGKQPPAPPEPPKERPQREAKSVSFKGKESTTQKSLEDLGRKA
ncbi:MAG: cation:proton antiporter [Thermoplasmatota archaeon]